MIYQSLSRVWCFWQFFSHFKSPNVSEPKHFCFHIISKKWKKYVFRIISLLLPSVVNKHKSWRSDDWLNIPSCTCYSPCSDCRGGCHLRIYLHTCLRANVVYLFQLVIYKDLTRTLSKIDILSTPIGVVVSWPHIYTQNRYQTTLWILSHGCIYKQAEWIRIFILSNHLYTLKQHRLIRMVERRYVVFILFIL